MENATKKKKWKDEMGRMRVVDLNVGKEL